MWARLRPVPSMAYTNMLQVAAEVGQQLGALGGGVMMTPLPPDVDASVGLGVCVAELLEQGVDAVVSHPSGLLEAVERALELEHLVSKRGVVDAVRDAHVQILVELAVEVRLVDVGLGDEKTAGCGKT